MKLGTGNRSYSCLIGGKSCRNRRHMIQLILDCATCFTQFVFILQTHPELNGCAEYSGQAQCSIRSDTALAQHNFVDATRWHTNRMRQPGLAYFHWTQKLFEEYFTRVNVLQFIHSHLLNGNRLSRQRPDRYPSTQNRSAIDHLYECCAVPFDHLSMLQADLPEESEDHSTTAPCPA